MIIAALRNDQHYRRNKGKARAQIGGNLALGDKNIQQRNLAVHEQAGSWIHIE